jgi:quercetin dioxygenase-like cupin family protein
MRPHIAAVLLWVGLLVCSGIGQDRGAEVRLSPAEVDAILPIDAGPGTSGVKGIHTRVLHGDPTKPGLYTIRLTIPPNTHIKAHKHPDDRIATVISGTWFIGYGDAFDEKKVKALTPGSFYTEPPGIVHFARTGKQGVVVEITGYGPTGTDYIEH